MSQLKEFSNIIIFKDTPVTRFYFGTPLDETQLKNNTSAPSSGLEPFYSRLKDKPNATDWRLGNPDITSILQAGGPPPNTPFSDIRSFVLNAIGKEENDAVGYNLSPQSSGTGIINNNKFYVGNTQTVSYSGIVANATDVTVSGNFTGVANSTKVVLSTVGSTGLSTSTVYYIYNASGTDCNLSTSSSSYVEIDNLDGNAGSGTAYLAPATFDYVLPTTFATPNPALGVGDFIFWGNDPNSLNIGGKIKQVYEVGDSEYADGARYLFDNDTALSFTTTPQPIYYYRKGWNGKDVKNNTGSSPLEPAGAGFYVILGVEKENGIPCWYPYLGQDNTDAASNNSATKVVDTSTSEKYAFTDLVRIRKISNRFKSDETVDSLFAGDLIPCTIHRTSAFYWDTSTNALDSNGNLQSVLKYLTVPFQSIAPEWVAYYVNPYGGSANKLDKNTTYVLEINEMLPAAQVLDGLSVFQFARVGSI